MSTTPVATAGPRGRSQPAPAGARPASVSELDLRLSRLGRGERVITWSRVVLAAFALFAVWLDPAEPARMAGVAYALLFFYVLYAVVIALVLSRLTAPLPAFTVVVHAIDLTLAIAVNALTGPGSPFFVLFVFLLVAATLRWQWRGALVTGVAALVAFVTLAFFGLEGVGEAGFQLNRFIIRGSYLVVVAVLLGFMGTWEARLRRDLVDLAYFPRRRRRAPESTTIETMTYAANLLRSPRVLVAWEDSEEPWVETALCQDGELVRRRHDPEAISPLVAEELEPASFLCLDLAGDPPTSLYDGEAGFKVWRGQPLNPELTRRVSARSVLSVPVSGEAVTARIFAFDIQRPTSDDLILASILGRQIVAAIEQQLLMQETERAAANQERVRLANEIHDGVAQSLTAAAFQISGLRRTVAANPEATAIGLEQLERLLVNEQRELRLLLQDLRPSTAGQGTLSARLRELCHRVSALWSVEVELAVDSEQPMSWDVYRLLQEAMVNAARHSQATRIQVEVRAGTKGPQLRVEDNGKGFPFQGVYDLSTLMAARMGPLSLKERVASLDGEMKLTTGPGGTVIEIELPTSSGEGTT